MAWSLSDDRSHVQIITGKKYLHPSVKQVKISVINWNLLLVVETIVVIWVEVLDNSATVLFCQVGDLIVSKEEENDRYDGTKRWNCNLLKELEDLVGSDFLILVAIDSAEGSIGLKVLNLSQNLPLSFNFKLALRKHFQEISKTVLRL